MFFFVNVFVSSFRPRGSLDDSSCSGVHALALAAQTDHATGKCTHDPANRLWLVNLWLVSANQERLLVHANEK